MIRKGLLSLGCVLLASIASPAHAGQQVLGIKGIISSSALALPADIPLGTTVTIQLTYDDTAVDPSAIPTFASYSIPMMEVSIALIGASALHLGSVIGTGEIHVFDDDFDEVEYADRISFFPEFTLGAPQIQLSSLNNLIDVIGIELTEVSGSPPTTLTTTALPIAPFPLISEFSTEHDVIILMEDITTGALNTFQVTILEMHEGGSLATPIIPNSIVTNPDGTITFFFGSNGVTLFPPSSTGPIGSWIDPPTSPSFTYAMTNSALFTGISDFPTGFNDDFEVTAGGTSLGLFGPGDSVSFPGGGVSEFVVSGIDPLADVGDVEAFPLKLTFDSLDATFTMTSGLVPGVAVPALGNWRAVLVFALFGALYSVRKNRHFAEFC